MFLVAYMKVIFNGHRVKLKVTEAIIREIPYYRNVNFDRFYSS